MNRRADGSPAWPDLVADLLERCRFSSESPLRVAVSGGPDSLALLALACATGCEVTAYHVDHGLREGSGSEAEVVEEAAERLGASFVALKATLDSGPNLEARARDERKRLLPAGTATGHTADDQAETVLLNLLRGAGLPGLGAMRRGPTHPILSLRRAETAKVCAQVGLVPLADPSNDDPVFLRNRVRHELLPFLCSLSGRDVVPLLVRQAELAGADSDLLDDLAGGIDPRDATIVAGSPLPLARRALRLWLVDARGHPPGSADIDRVVAVAKGQIRGTQISGARRVDRKGRSLVLGAAGAG